MFDPPVYAWPCWLLWFELLINGWIFILVNELDQFWYWLYKALTKNRIHRFYSVLHKPSNNMATPNMFYCLTFSFDIINHRWNLPWTRACPWQERIGVLKITCQVCGSWSKAFTVFLPFINIEKFFLRWFSFHSSSLYINNVYQEHFVLYL